MSDPVSKIRNWERGFQVGIVCHRACARRHLWPLPKLNLFDKETWHRLFLILLYLFFGFYRTTFADPIEKNL